MYTQFTEVRFASFLSAGFTTYGSNKFTGKETGKSYLKIVLTVFTSQTRKLSIFEHTYVSMPDTFL